MFVILFHSPKQLALKLLDLWIQYVQVQEADHLLFHGYFRGEERGEGTKKLRRWWFPGGETAGWVFKDVQQEGNKSAGVGLQDLGT